MKPMLIAGNWKMNTNRDESVILASDIYKNLKEKNLNLGVLICPPFTSLDAVSGAIDHKKVMLGAQNCYFAPKGAFTGEVSIPMLMHIGCEYVIIGHSERRTIFNESNELINEKVKAVLKEGLIPILCIGETLDERKNNKTFEVVEKHLTIGLNEIEQSDFHKIVIAYEPVWAIGTGLAATVEQISEAHQYIRSLLKDSFGKSAEKTIILYGGSVTDENADSILELNDVNGALIGGASLKLNSFLSIIDKAQAIINRDRITKVK